MYIKSVILEGFKSYKTRTEIHGFDPEFTAITGLNGTGKSNILDSICFVLGIMNLGQVRANSLQELIYKSGNAGVDKATVTVIFDNSDPNQCPLGYEKCREISVTRQIGVGGGNKNKYFINGKQVQNKKISDFFCSVQLNVNNPSFLIMQGRITKVLNMKPGEILSMIEEAAGTSMYESKREATTKLIEKKDAKVRETNVLLNEEVLPKLEKLRKERTEYQEYQQICRDVEYLERIFVSSRYIKQEEVLKHIDENIEKINERIENFKNTMNQNDTECVQLEESSKILQEKIDKECGGELKEREIKLNEQLQIEAKAAGNLKAAQSSIEQEERKLRALEKNIAEDQKALQKKEAAMAKVQSLFESLKEADANDAKAYEDAQRKYEAVTQGLSTNEDGQSSSLQDQLISAEQQFSTAQTTIKTANMELRHCRKVLQDKQSETQTNDAAYNKDKQLYDKLAQEIKQLEQRMQMTNYEPGRFENLQTERTNINEDMRNLKLQLDRTNAYHYKLNYKDPEPNFDRSKERGMVGKLFVARDPKNYLALTMAAGGGLYSYVTEDDVTSKKILENGKLQNRVTLIPINKIMSQPIPQKTIDFAQKLVGAENVQSALSLIDYDPYYEPVMRFIFGNTLICRDLNVSKKVTYHPNIRCRSVTLDGDIVDPEGTLTGGSRPSNCNVLEELTRINTLEKNITTRKTEFEQICEQLNAIEQTARQFNRMKETLELRQHELEACKQRLAQTSFQQHQSEIDELKVRVQKLEQDLVESREVQNTAQAKIKDIQAKLADAKGYRERELKAASDLMKLTKKKSEESRNNWKKREQEYDTLKGEIEDLRKSIAASEEQYASLTENLKQSAANLEALRNDSSDVSQHVAALKQSIKEQKDVINMQNKELKQLLVKRDKLQKQNQEIKLDLKKKENELIKSQNEKKEAQRKIEAYEEKYTWIREERKFFGLKNTRYDYTKQDPEQAGKKLTSMREKKEKMERHINMRAMIMLEREEEQYEETLKRKQQVEQDKEKIKHIIKRMDEKKREEVERAWKQVDSNFSSIFSMLLQGANAALKPVKQGSIMVGFEIKVGFNNVWKESLGELSGGQRSLVALSLVLAMLKFSPAPLYILDEVDAALDMSHTQNIGNMLKQHFKSSQFIIVSLKDGMFNNANVLFRTKFEDGYSAVTRSVNPRLTARSKH